MAAEPVRLFVDSAANGPRAAAAAEAVEAAAAAFPRARLAVRSVVAATGQGGVAGAGDGEVEPANAAAHRGGEGGELGGGEDGAVVEEGGRGRRTEGLAAAQVQVNGGTGGGGGRGGGGRGGGGGGGGRGWSRAGEAESEEMWAMGREDAVARVATCREALEGWWERQLVAVEEGLQDRENEAADRR